MRLGLRRAWRRLKKRRRARQRAGSFVPRAEEICDHAELIAHAARLTGRPSEEVQALFADYRDFHRQKDYQARFGEEKTLCFEESFLVYLFLRTLRPATIVEIGTQYGKSTRRILDMVGKLETGSRVVCFDVEDQVKHFAPGEARLVLEDVTNTFRRDVLDDLQPGLIYLDARPYHLLRNAIGEFVRSGAPCVMAIHDCARGLCNREMKLDRSDPDVSSETGVWERWALAEVFGFADPLDPGLDSAETPTHVMRIFPTRHGLAVIVPRVLLPIRSPIAS